MMALSDDDRFLGRTESGVLAPPAPHAECPLPACIEDKGFDFLTVAGTPGEPQV